MFYKKAGLKNFAKFTGKQLRHSLFFFIKLQAETEVQADVFSCVIFAKFLRAPILQNTSGRLLNSEKVKHKYLTACNLTKNDYFKDISCTFSNYFSTAF